MAGGELLRKFLVAQASRLCIREQVTAGSARPTYLFMFYGWAKGPCATVPKSSSGGTGFPACVDRLAGAEARPTNLFMLYG